MSSLDRIVAAHPLRAQRPYDRIKFSRVNQHRVAVYKVGRGKTEFGADRALREAYRRFGGDCFHCRKPIELDQFTLDHLRPKRDDGGEHLHNLVFSCLDCNRSKAGKGLASFEAEVADAYLKALDEHIVRALKELTKKQR